MCKRAEQDSGWCISHHADFLAGATSCEAVLRPSPTRGRPRPVPRDGYVERALERRLSPMSAIPVRRS